MKPKHVAEFDQLRAQYSELLADYSFLENNANVLLKNHARFVLNLGDTPEGECTELFQKIQALIEETGLEYTLEICDGQAVYKMAGTPQ